MVIRQTNFLGQMRVDVPLLRAMESSVAADFDLAAGTIFAGRQALIVRGFSLTNISVGLPADQIQCAVASSVMVNFNATESGSMYSVPSNRPNEIISSTNPKVSGAFTSSATNFIGIDLRRSADPTTSDVLQFLNATTLIETPKTVPLARTLDYRFVISTADFASQPNLTPLAKVVTDSSNSILSVQDARQLAFRLGTGGDFPNVQNFYPWPAGRTEPLGSDVFSGGDKAIQSQKEWQDAAMSRMWDIGGGEHWYSATADRNVNMVWIGPAFLDGENFEWDGTNLHWQGIRFIFDNSTGYFNDVKDQTTDSVGLTNLVDGDCIYVDLDRTQNFTNPNGLQAAKAALTTLGPGAIPGARNIIAWRVGANIYTRGWRYPIGTLFIPATTSSQGVLKISRDYAGNVTAGLSGLDNPIAISDRGGIIVAPSVTVGNGFNGLTITAGTTTAVAIGGHGLVVTGGNSAGVPGLGVIGTGGNATASNFNGASGGTFQGGNGHGTGAGGDGLTVNGGASGGGLNGGRGIVANGQLASEGGNFTGGGNGGAGVVGNGGGGGAKGGVFTGAPTGNFAHGVTGTGGATGGTNCIGGVFTGGAVNGHGVFGTAPAVGDGGHFISTLVGAGVYGQGGSVTGNGGTFVATDGNSLGATGQGQGSGAGLSGTGGATDATGVIGNGGGGVGSGVVGNGAPEAGIGVVGNGGSPGDDNDGGDGVVGHGGAGNGHGAGGVGVRGIGGPGPGGASEGGNFTGSNDPSDPGYGIIATGGFTGSIYGRSIWAPHGDVVVDDGILSVTKLSASGAVVVKIPNDQHYGHITAVPKVMHLQHQFQVISGTPTVDTTSMSAGGEPWIGSSGASQVLLRADIRLPAGATLPAGTGTIQVLTVNGDSVDRNIVITIQKFTYNSGGDYTIANLGSAVTYTVAHGGSLGWQGATSGTWSASTLDTDIVGTSEGRLTIEITLPSTTSDHQVLIYGVRILYNMTTFAPAI